MLGFLYHFTLYRILPIIFSIVSFYYVIEMNITGFKAAATYYYADTFNMSTGCPIGTFTCTHLTKMSFYPGADQLQLYYVGVLLFMVETILVAFLGLLVIGLYYCITNDYERYKATHKE